MADRIEDVPSSEELNAYIDGALPAAHTRRVEAYLARHPSEATRLDAYRRQDARLRTAFDPLRLDEPPPEIATLSARLSGSLTRHNRIRGMARYAAMGLLCVAAAAAGRWSADVGTNPGGDPTVLAQSRIAADAYRLVTAHSGQSALDQSATPAELSGWLTDGESKIRIPRLQLLGYRQIGGQVLPTGAGPAVQLVYNDDKKGPFSLYVARAPECVRAKPRYTRDGELSLMSWCQNRAVFMLIGKLDRTAMLWIAEAVSQPDPQPSVAADDRDKPAVERTAVGGDR